MGRKTYLRVRSNVQTHTLSVDLLDPQGALPRVLTSPTREHLVITPMDAISEAPIS